MKRSANAGLWSWRAWAAHHSFKDGTRHFALAFGAAVLPPLGTDREGARRAEEQ